MLRGKLQELEPDPATANLFGGAVGSPPAAIGDAPEFLDVDMDQLSGAVAFMPVSARPGGADQLIGSHHASGATPWRVRMRETVLVGVPGTAAMRSGPARSRCWVSRTRAYWAGWVREGEVCRS